jgi:hypothetical protein
MATSTDLRAAILEVQDQLPAPQATADGETPPGETGWAARVERRVGALPWWVISAATHAVLFLLVGLLATAVAPPLTDEVIISTDVVKQKPPEYDPEKKRDIFKNTRDVQAETQVDNPVVTHEKTEESDHFETDNNLDKRTSRGQEDAISDIPLGGTGTVGSIGVGGGGMAGVFGYRDGGGRKKAVGRFGGSQATESAVEAALRWLSRHQEPDGSWDTAKYEAQGGNAKCRVGCTGLALLAFLGAGYTEKSGQFADNVKRAEQWLMKQQKPSGGIFEGEGSGWDTSAGYHHAVAALALAEASGMAKDPEVGKVAQKAADYSLKVHQKPYSGWRYDAKADDPDVSVTGWFVMQLKSAKIAGLKIDGAGFQGAQNLLDAMTDKDGRVMYGASGHTTRTPSMTAVGMVCRQFMGAPSDSPMLVKGAEFLVKELPNWQKNQSTGDFEAGDYGFYYWYYGTLAMFQMGGEKWGKWNEALKPVLVSNQCRGPLPLGSGAEDRDGSWDPKGQYVDKEAGRVFTTALGALTLEVYYRYLPMYSK